ncbi:hypothetical protein NDU88_005839 [Pleurodeles waltl]|uniref:Uncharacterized protein n=1 Tax=Pleurodeles waltl TaxID=8319 RepID=A0AAV7L615_PLEWA|nr:hypothetical protein NDU88_005839 [Pleurodeles waltl]
MFRHLPAWHQGFFRASSAEGGVSIGDLGVLVVHGVGLVEGGIKALAERFVLHCPLQDVRGGAHSFKALWRECEYIREARPSPAPAIVLAPGPSLAHRIMALLASRLQRGRLLRASGTITSPRYRPPEASILRR